MRFNEDTIDEINKKIESEKKYYDLGLKIGFNGDSVVQYSGSSGWHICKLSDLTNMIKSLEDLRTQIECVTGVKC